ncbi:uncharacterized protein LOC126569182 isoform X2 [Anopheles aquasalis]|uniref:uncharacterized protein LOC126569182 isoform X2 n=1 Tax=Anopheles aquasalis TaxID=42839 RepID=UPI00215AF74E|nr:uncharacterized protein LOC126569182 isoform X2 [Anopheles aquasalis]
MKNVRAAATAAAAAAPEATLSPDGSFTDETGARPVGKATVPSARDKSRNSDLTSSQSTLESYARLTRNSEGSDYSWTRQPRSARASDNIIEERNPTTKDDSSPTDHSATQRELMSIHSSDSESHRTTTSSGTSVILDSTTDNQTSLLQVVHDDLELSALAATAGDSYAFATKKGAHVYHGKQHHNRHRRLSDGLPGVGESYGRGGGTQYAVGGTRDLDGGAPQISCTSLSAIMEAIKDSTELINRTISEKMRDSEPMSRPRSAVSSSNSLPTASRFHSLGPHSPSPSVHASLQGGSAFHQSYSPGVISDMVREIRENSRVREEAFMANVRSIMEDRSWMQNETLTRLTRDVEDLKRGFQSVRTDVDGMKSTLDVMRSEVANFGLQMNYLIAQHQQLAHAPPNYTTTSNLTHGQPTPPLPPIVVGGLTIRRGLDNSCLQQQQKQQQQQLQKQQKQAQQPPHHTFYPAATPARLSMPPVPPDDITGKYGAKPGGSTVYEMVPNATNHNPPSSPRAGLLVREDVSTIVLDDDCTSDNDCSPIVVGDLIIRRTMDHSCLQQQQQQPPHHHFYPAAATTARLSMPPVPPDDITGEYGAKPGGSTVYATNHNQGQGQGLDELRGLYEEQIAALTRRTLSLQGELELSKRSGRNGHTSPPDSLPNSGRPGPVGTTVQAGTSSHGMVSPRDNLPYLQMLTGPVTDL